MADACVSLPSFRPLKPTAVRRLANRTHRKLLIADGRVGMTGGVGIAEEWTGNAQDPDHWRDTHVRVSPVEVLAAELLAEPDVKALVPLIKALPPQRIAVIGHSVTMQLHWSTPGAFVPIVTAIFARENPGVEFRQFEGGGLTSTRAPAPPSGSTIGS